MGGTKLLHYGFVVFIGIDPLRARPRSMSYRSGLRRWSACSRPTCGHLVLALPKEKLGPVRIQGAAQALGCLAYCGRVLMPRRWRLISRHVPPASLHVMLVPDPAQPPSQHGPFDWLGLSLFFPRWALASAVSFGNSAGGPHPPLRTFVASGIWPHYPARASRLRTMLDLSLFKRCVAAGIGSGLLSTQCCSALVHVPSTRGRSPESSTTSLTLGVMPIASDHRPSPADWRAARGATTYCRRMALSAVAMGRCGVHARSLPSSSSWRLGLVSDVHPPTMRHHGAARESSRECERRAQHDRGMALPWLAFTVWSSAVAAPSTPRRSS